MRSSLIIFKFKLGPTIHTNLSTYYLKGHKDHEKRIRPEQFYEKAQQLEEKEN